MKTRNEIVEEIMDEFEKLRENDVKTEEEAVEIIKSFLHSSLIRISDISMDRVEVEDDDKIPHSINCGVMKDSYCTCGKVTVNQIRTYKLTQRKSFIGE